MDDLDDFNSSDIEMPAPVADPRASLGKASIEEMLDRALEHRIESKIKTRLLTNSRGAPGTVQDRSRWRNRFTAFCDTVLNHRPGTVPTCRDIERFLFEVVDHLRGRVSQIDPTKSMPSFTLLRNGLWHVIDNLQFDHPTFLITKHDRKRISNVMDQLEREGKLTKDPKREKQWLGAFVVLKISTAFFQDALANGTLSWDITLQKIFSIVLTAALITRSGETARNDKYEGLECLLYEHIKLKLVIKDGVEIIEGLITLYNEKAKKKKRTFARKVHLTAIMDPRYNIVCPISLLIIMALRLGAVQDADFDSVLQRTRARADKTVVWAKPRMPVLCAVDIHTHQLIESKPAPGIQITRNTQLGAELAGIAQHVIAHDIRRGGFRDLAYLKTAIGGRMSGVAEIAGHSQGTVAQGITKLYAGYSKGDNWKRRLEENDTNDDFGVDFLEAPFKKQRFESDAITEYCNANDLDSTDRVVRDRARMALRKTVKREWSEKGLGAAKDGADSDEMQDEPTDGQSFDQVLDPRLFDGSPSPDTNTMTPSLSEGRSISPEETISQDEESQALDLLVSGLGVDNVEEFALTETPGSNLAQLTSEPYDFIRTFSRINTVRSLTTLDKAGFTITGNSRDEPVRFKFSCPNVIFGCKQTLFSEQELSNHVQICQLTSHEAYQAAQEKENSKTFCCDKPGCNKKFDDKHGLRWHQKVHSDKNWDAKTCDVADCPEPNKIFKSKTSWVAHRRSAHGSYQTQSCSVPECKNTTIFDKKDSYLNHLRRVHQMSGEPAKAFIHSASVADH